MAIRIIKNNKSVQGHFVLVFLIILISKILFINALAPTISSQQNVMMSETVVAVSKDSEKEAKELYDKALLEYGQTGRPVRKICKTWEEKGCQCSGTSEEVHLICRGIGFNEVPNDLPIEIFKL